MMRAQALNERTTKDLRMQIEQTRPIQLNLKTALEVGIAQILRWGRTLFPML